MQPPASSRIVSMDQFRGCTVAGMILVNFVGDFKLIEQAYPVLQHHNTYFSYADTIMPAFHFAVGFALRLTLLRRLRDAPRTWPVYLRAIRRCLGLILLSIVLSPLDHRFASWPELRNTGVWNVLAGPLKCQFWETLAIIGVTSIWVLPVIAAGVRARIAFLVACAAAHVALSYWFYFDFLWAKPNVLDAWWGASSVRGLDGGPFGFLVWAIPQLVGSLAYDAVASKRDMPAVVRLMGWSFVLMLLGYGLSCLSVLYNTNDPAFRNTPSFPVAESPVVPPRVDLAGSEVRSLLAEPPFVQSPPPERRPWNYWMMSKRAGTLSFMLFASGFALAVYVFFVLLSDLGHLQIGLFRTFGQNPLAAYIIHELVNNSVNVFAPRDSPLSWIATTFVLYAGITYLLVRYLEKREIYLRM
jgi:predicted acyltransferase